MFFQKILLFDYIHYFLGMCPVSLKDALQSAKRPAKYIYINPNGANPTGTILSENRRSDIYKLVCEHDLILLEDDPYYYVQV